MGMPQLPKVGMRMVKSATAVFLCFAVALLRRRFLPCLGEGIPFYSAIAAVLCMQPYVSNSVKTALNRTAGTVVGAVAGTLFLLLERGTALQRLPWLQYLLLSACIIPLIYITVLIRIPAASYITCVVFMSITVSHGADVNPYLFALNRMADTLIGIFLSLGVNMFRLPRPKDRGLLMAAGMDGVLTPPGGVLAPHVRIRLTRLAERGAAVTVFSPSTPGELLPRLGEADLRLPMIVMGGAALYDRREARYPYSRPLDDETLVNVRLSLEASGLRGFFYVVVHDSLHVYHGELLNPAETDQVDRLHGSPHEHYVRGPMPAGAGALQICAADTPARLTAWENAAAAQPWAARIRTIRRPLPGREGYEMLTIRAADAPAAAVAELRVRIGAQRTAAFGFAGEDALLLQASDQAYAAAGAEASVRQAADVLLESGDLAAVKAMERLYLRGGRCARAEKKEAPRP